MSVGGHFANRKLPIALEGAIGDIATLGEDTQRFVRKAFNDLWFRATQPMQSGELFVSTGDIPAMWIRDSVWQVRPLLRWAWDPEVADYLVRVFLAQLKFLEIDPYANAFNPEPNGFCWHKDFVGQSPWVFERKFELDSITAFLQFSLELSDALPNKTVLDSRWLALLEILLSLMESETTHDKSTYRLVRHNAPEHDYLSNDGYGAAFENVGLIWSAFRPSDDACALPFNIPANLHAAAVLQKIGNLSLGKLSTRSAALSQMLFASVHQHAIVKFESNPVLAYEIDGLGNHVLDEDANFPNLLSLPFLGLEMGELYQNTRARSLSESNRWFFRGDKASGLGSPHTGDRMVWPLAIAMQGLTSASAEDKLKALRVIEATSCNDSIHESFDVDDPKVFTREWFSWAQMMHVELAFEVLSLRGK